MNLSEYASASSSSPRSAHHGVGGVEQQRRSLSSRSSLVGTAGQQQQQQRSSSSRARAAAPSSGRRMRRIRRIRPRPLAPPWRRRFLPWLLALLGVFIAAAIVYRALTAAAAVSRDRTAAVHSLRSAGGPHTTLKELNELRRREGRLAAELRNASAAAFSNVAAGPVTAADELARLHRVARVATARLARLRPCCNPHGGQGCHDAAISACVCAREPSCCSGSWTLYCTELVEMPDTRCGRCVDDETRHRELSERTSSS